MKKIICAVLTLLLLCGCQAKVYTPVLNTDFSENAVFQTGDFSYNANVQRKEGVVSVKVNSTAAAGMVITYDGSTVTFNQNGMQKALSGENIDKTNPAVAIYDVFNYLDTTADLQCSKTENGYKYNGTSRIGEFNLIQNTDGTYNTIVFPQADLKITFQ